MSKAIDKTPRNWGMAAVWIAVFVPQFVLVAGSWNGANSWKGIASTLPLMGSGLLGVAAVVAGVLAVAVIAASVAIWLKQARVQGRGA